MRLSLPDFLVSPFKTLEHEAFLIAQRVPGTKRAIKFDDAERSVVLDIKLPGASWVRITSGDVIQAVGARKKERVPAVSEILAISGRPLPPPVDRRGDNGDGIQQSQEQHQQQQQCDQSGEERFFDESDADMNGDEVAGESA